MAVLHIGLALALLVNSLHGTPLPQTNVTVQQLYNAMSQLIVKNMQLEASMKNLQGENGRLTTTNKQLERELEQEKSKTLSCEKTLNTTIEDKSICSEIKTRFDEDKKKLASNLAQCVSVKKSLQRNQIINHHVLNASKMAHDECKNDLAKLSDVKSKLEQCQRIPAKFPSTCQSWKDAGYSNDGKYMIDPDGPGGVDSFEVECLMNSHYNVPMIVIHHDSEARLDAAPNRLVAAYSNVRNVVYQAAMQQIIAAIEVSAKCEQFIKVECYDSAITDHDTWYSRDGTPMYYWGGATPGSGKCACGMTNTCDNPHGFSKVYCNCDANDYVWRSDSGFLTDRSTLPVTKMAFGDLDQFSTHGEQAYHTLGALRCYG